MKQDVLALLDELIELTILDEGDPQSFRVRAYDTARRAIETAGTDVTTMSESDLLAMKGIGKSTAAKIREFVTTGRLTKLEELRAEYPPDFVLLTKIPGIGPKTARRLRNELGIRDLPSLEAALDAHQLRELPGFGPTKERKIADAIEKLGMRGKERRFPIAEALPVATALVDTLRSIVGVVDACYCGSLRRFRDTVADVDIVVAATDAEAIGERVVELPLVSEILAHGTTKTSFVTHTGLQVDVRVVAPHQFGAAIQYFTGSKAHNIEVRRLAVARDWTLNEYGLSDRDSVIASRTEEEIYRALGLQWITPEMREGTGEIELAARGDFPDLITIDHIRGDLHDHTERSGDGRAPLGAIVEAARDAGLEYVAITDHGEDLTINGLSRGDLLTQRAEIAELQEALPDVRILHGCELNIAPDGSVDYDAEFLAGFDWCVASVHDHFDLPAERQTARLITAMRNPAVRAIGHLSGRMIGRRPGIEFDVDAVLEAAATTGTVLEINGALERLDAAPEIIRAGSTVGVRFAISTDAHHPSEIRPRMEWGVRNARRGWLPAEHVVNAWPADRFLEWLAAGKDRRSAGRSQ